MEEALSSGELDIVGIARPFAIQPDFPNKIFAKQIEKIEAPITQTGIKAIDQMGIMEVLWYELQIKRLGEGKKPDEKFSLFKTMAHRIKMTVSKTMKGNQS